MICSGCNEKTPLLRPGASFTRVVYGEPGRAPLRVCMSVLASLCVAAVVAPNALAEEPSFMVAQSVLATGEPSVAYVLAVQGGRVIGLAPALALLGVQPGEMLVTGRVSSDKVGPGSVTVLATVVMKDGAVASSVRTLARETAILDVNALRSRAAARRAAQGQPQQSASGKLAQVNAEAGELLKLERAIGGENPAAGSDGNRRRLLELRQLVKQRKESIKTQSTPVAFKKRESELSAELNALTTALRDEEARHRDGSRTVSPELQAKLDLIESTKNEHIDLLRKELLELRRERER